MTVRISYAVVAALAWLAFAAAAQPQPAPGAARLTLAQANIIVAKALEHARDQKFSARRTTRTSSSRWPPRPRASSCRSRAAC